MTAEVRGGANDSVAVMENAVACAVAYTTRVPLSVPPA